MKWMVLLLAVWAGLWLVKRNQARREALKQAAWVMTPHLPVVQPMVACSHCGTHSPANECVSGVHGIYCSLEHVQAAEGTR